MHIHMCRHVLFSNYLDTGRVAIATLRYQVFGRQVGYVGLNMAEVGLEAMFLVGWFWLVGKMQKG